MTNAPEGRTYIDYTWVLKDHTFWSPRFPRDYVQVATPHIIPNGKWVMERPHGWAWLIGITPDELETFSYTDKNGVRYTLRIGDKPFGYTVADEEDVDLTVYPPVLGPNGRRTLFCARQVHRGELGQTVPIERLNYVRQALEPDESPSVRRRRKHGQRGWIRLDDLAAATGLRSADIVYGFWNYSGHLHWRDGRCVGVMLDIVRASSEDMIKETNPVIFSVTAEEIGNLLGGWHGQYFYAKDVWVRRGFAYTVLRLLALGVRPEATQPV